MYILIVRAVSLSPSVMLAFQQRRLGAKTRQIIKPYGPRSFGQARVVILRPRKAETSTDDLGIVQVKIVIANRAPFVGVKDFDATGTLVGSPNQADFDSLNYWLLENNERQGKRTTQDKW